MLVFGGMAKVSASQAARAVNAVWKLSLVDRKRAGTGEGVSGTWSLVQTVGEGPVARFDHAGIAYNDG